MAFIGQMEIEEVFMIKTDEIGFVGIMAKEKEGNYEVHGRVFWTNGVMYYFHHQAEKKSILREKTCDVCNAIADFYETEVTYQKFHRPIKGDEIIPLLSAGMQIYN